MNEQYKLIRSKRKTLSMSVSNEGELIVRAPLRLSIKEIENFINKHNVWIEKNVRHMKEIDETSRTLTEEEIIELRKKANIVLRERTSYFSDIMGVVPSKIRITNARLRWGSCSGRDSICFSYRLMLLPEDVVDYVVVHELAHIKVKNHQDEFYEEVCKVLPDHEKRVERLRKLERLLPRSPG